MLKSDVAKEIRIGLPKGIAPQRLREETIRYTNEPALLQQLSYFNAKRNIYLYLVKPRDIPKLVNDGLLDVGITSQEWVQEKGWSLHTHRVLDWCDTRISLLTPPTKPVIKQGPFSCITEFPNLTKRFFAQQGITDFTIEHVSGSCEAFVPSMFDCAVDCVETGSSMRKHGLTEEAILLYSQIVITTRHAAVSPEIATIIQEVQG